ncbi:MAG: dephospho-CoA kinase [Acidobacteriaceae bacterium]|jgi:dephospho-CoA kinase|nr:dephospho-CoA kinase [Acidobacteriaceae bacterium]
MLRVGLTGGLGSGKTTVAGIFRSLGAQVMAADTVGRAMMEPGEAVYDEIVRVFGPAVVRANGTLDRHKLATIAFTDGQLAELNAIVHPPVIAEQRRWMEALEREQPEAVAIYETALLFEASKAAGTRDWQERFDRRILVTAPEALRIARYVARMGGPDADAATRAALEEEARQRMAAQMSEEEKMRLSDTIIRNDTSLEDVTRQTEAVYRELRALATASR